jgi:hypothetical protein
LDHQELIEEAQRDPPALVLLDGEQLLRTYAQPIVDYVRRRYAKDAQAGPMSVYVPK